MNDRLEYLQGWLRKAANDMKIATREMEAPDPASDAVCFHFQQAVEKWLKSWLIWHDVAYPTTHNIEVLLVACEKIDKDFHLLREVEALTPYAVEIRYADDAYFPSREEMEQARDLAVKTREFILNRLKSLGIEIG
jgi:HEPN domain-containing protein